TFTDSTTQNLTSQVTWTSAKPTVATIAAGGLASALAVGTTNITASMTGVTSSADVLTVTNALTSIAVTPNPATAVRGTTLQFTATGTYADGTTQNLTSSVTWISSAAGVAAISSSGLASAW